MSFNRRIRRSRGIFECHVYQNISVYSAFSAVLIIIIKYKHYDSRRVY
nr:MAG TPA: hypothetical protein [Caudoviricetes sp.]